MVFDFITILYLILSFLIGSVPFGLVLTHLFSDINLRQIGSGNIGATNVLRTGRKGLAVATLLADALKGGLAVLIIGVFANADLAAICGLAAVLGHCFPPWLKFRGGKGVATGIATLLAIDWMVGLICIFTWLVMAFLFRYSSLAALAGFAVSAVLVWANSMTGFTAMIQLSGIQLWVITALSALIILRHHQNIARLRSGTESRITFRK